MPKAAIDQSLPGISNAVVLLDAVTKQPYLANTELCNVLSLTLSLDTAAYADGDVLADTQALASAARVNGGVIEIRNLTVVDKDDQGQPFDIWVFSTNVSLGTENSVPSISDANAIQIFGKIEVSTIDFYDLGGCKVATPSFIPFLIKAASDSQSIYVGAVSRGTGTYTASGIVLNLGIRQF